VGRRLWRDVGSIVFSFCWASSEQLFRGLSPTGFMSIFDFLYFWDSTNLESQVPVSKFKFYCYRWSVGQFFLVSGPHWGRRPDFKFTGVTITFFLLHVVCPLWRGDWSTICNAITLKLESRWNRNHTRTLLSHFRLPQTRGSGLITHIPINIVVQQKFNVKIKITLM
jgi:hypothetical protein